MKTFNLTITFAAVLAFSLAGFARAADECCPADGAQADGTQANVTLAQMPEGHPPIQKDTGKLPEGHPPMPQGGALPQGHPELPQGHPPMGGQSRTMSNEPFTASIVVKAVLGTKDGAPVAGKTATVEMMSAGKVAKKIEATLDEHGVAMLEGIEVSGMVQPIVTINYAGVPYQEVGRVMAAQQPDQVIRVSVYESTKTKPEWTIGMRHVMVRPMAQGLDVIEMIVLNNPTDKAWVGEADADTKADAEHPAKSATYALPLPAGATKVRLGDGLDECCTDIKPDELIAHTPLMPGQTQLRFAYLLPVKDGKAEVKLTNATAVQQMIVFVPEDGSTIVAKGLGEPQSMGGHNMALRMYKAAQVKPTDNISLTITGIKETPAVKPTKAAAEMDAPKTATDIPTPKIIAGIGGSVMLLALGVLVLRHGHDKPKPTDETDTK